LNGGGTHVGLDDLGADLEKVVNTGLDAAVITSLGDGDGTAKIIYVYICIYKDDCSDDDDDDTNVMMIMNIVDIEQWIIRARKAVG
jgi:hypothetical protein